MKVLPELFRHPDNIGLRNQTLGLLMHIDAGVKAQQKLTVLSFPIT